MPHHVKLADPLSFQTRFPKNVPNIQEASGLSMAPVEYPSRKSKRDIKETQRSMLINIFKYEYHHNESGSATTHLPRCLMEQLVCHCWYAVSFPRE